MASLDDNGSADLHVFKELFGHLMGHAHASVGRRISRQIAGMHTYSIGKTHEIRHRRIEKFRSRRNLVNPDIYVVIDRPARGLVLENTVDGRFVLLILFLDPIDTRWRAVIFLAT